MSVYWICILMIHPMTQATLEKKQHPPKNHLFQFQLSKLEICFYPRQTVNLLLTQVTNDSVLSKTEIEVVKLQR